MSALSSAIHNTGHYHVRPRPVCLPPSCARSANNGHSRRSSCVLASLDLVTRDARTVTNGLAYRLPQTCDRSAAGVLGLVSCSIAVWRRTSQERRGPDCRPSEGKKWTRKKFASWGRKAYCCARSSPLQAQKRRVLACPVLYRSGAPEEIRAPDPQIRSFIHAVF